MAKKLNKAKEDARSRANVFVHPMGSNDASPHGSAF